MIITFCGQKGGTGKTTLSYLVAETLSRAGKRVAIRDDDPQASVSLIVSELRESGRTEVEILEQGREGNYDFVVVDTLPRLSSRVLVEAVKEADRLILPLKPSMVDIRATVPAVQMVQENIRSAARAFVLWNMVKPGNKNKSRTGWAGSHARTSGAQGGSAGADWVYICVAPRLRHRDG